MVLLTPKKTTESNTNNGSYPQPKISFRQKGYHKEIKTRDQNFETMSVDIEQTDDKAQGSKSV